MAMPSQPVLPAPPARVPANRWETLEPAWFGTTPPTLKISVVVTCGNDDGRLAPCLGALTRQSYPADLVQVVVAASAADLPQQTGGPDFLRVDLPREGMGTGTARNRGAMAADGDVLVFLDGDVVLDASAVEAHARWHHVAGDAVTVGRSDAASPGSGTDGFELVLAASASNLGVAAAMFRMIGGYREHDLRAVEDAEFGYRLYNAGCLFVPEPQAAGSRPGAAMSAASGTTDDPQVGPHLAAYLPVPGVREPTPGRSYPVPRTLVIVPAADEPLARAAAAVEAVLASDDHDLVVRVLTTPDASPGDQLAARFLGDPRVEFVTGSAPVGSPHAPAYEAEPYHPAANQVWAPPGAVLSPLTLRRLVALLETGRVGVVHVTVPGQAPTEALVRAVRTRALARASRIADDGDPHPVIGELFGEEWLSGADLGITAAGEPVAQPGRPEVGPDVPLDPEGLLRLLGQAEERHYKTEERLRQQAAKAVQRRRTLQQRLQDDQDSHRERIRSLKAERRRDHRRIEQLEADRERFKADRERLKTDLRRLRHQLAQTRAALAEATRPNLLQRVVRLLRSPGRIPGVVGRRLRALGRRDKG